MPLPTHSLVLSEQQSIRPSARSKSINGKGDREGQQVLPRSTSLHVLRTDQSINTSCLVKNISLQEACGLHFHLLRGTPDPASSQETDNPLWIEQAGGNFPRI